MASRDPIEERLAEFMVNRLVKQRRVNVIRRKTSGRVFVVSGDIDFDDLAEAALNYLEETTR